MTGAHNWFSHPNPYLIVKSHHNKINLKAQSAAGEAIFSANRNHHWTSIHHWTSACKVQVQTSECAGMGIDSDLGLTVIFHGYYSICREGTTHISGIALFIVPHPNWCGWSGGCIDGDLSK